MKIWPIFLAFLIVFTMNATAGGLGKPGTPVLVGYAPEDMPQEVIQEVVVVHEDADSWEDPLMAVLGILGGVGTLMCAWYGVLAYRKGPK